MHWGHRRVRQLLRKLRTPGDIHRDELALALQRLTGARSPRDAVLAVAERALRSYPPVYWTVVRRADVEGESTRAIAEEIHLADRSFFRYRSAAISAIAAEIDIVTRAGPNNALPSSDIDALALYARGRYLWKHRTAASLRRAMRYFERALEHDPGFARAYAGIADVHLLMGEYLIRDPAEAFADAHAAVSAALTLDAALPEVHATLADLAMFERCDLLRAQASFDVALAIDPNYTTAHQFAAWLSIFREDPEGALRHLRAALEREPNSLELHTSLAKAYNGLDQPDAAYRHLDDVLDLDPGFSFARYEMVRVLTGVERYADALHHVRVLVADEPRPTFDAALCFLEAKMGNPAAARRFLDANGAEAQPHYLRALVSVGLGERDAALHELRETVRAAEPGTIMIRTDGFFRALHGDAEFERIAAETTGPPRLRAAG
jgi:tetratricopeptide (TPR) repeat protein